MNKVYVPEHSQFNKCVVLQSNDVLRVYDTTPKNNTSYNYRDYYIHDNYYYKDGSGSWGNTFNTLPVCYEPSLITNDFYYRLDFPNVLIMFTIISFFGIYLPICIFSKLFKKGSIKL